MPAGGYASRLLIAPWGKYRDCAGTRAPVGRRGRRCVTVAIAAPNIGQKPAASECSRRCRFEVHLSAEHGRLPTTPPTRYAPCASRASCSEGHDLVKLEVLGDPHTLYPNMPEP